MGAEIREAKEQNAMVRNPMKLLPIGLLLLGTTLLGCSKAPSEDQTAPVEVTVHVTPPTVLSDATLVSLEGKLRRGDETVQCTARKNALHATVVPGEWQLQAQASYREAGKSGTVSCTFDEPISVPRAPGGVTDIAVSLKYTASRFRDGFLITEVFVTGTTKPDGTQYNDDKYIIIANASESKTLFLDGYVLLCSNFLSSKKLACTPAVPLAQSLPVKVICQFPGGGHDYPVAPGRRVVVCQSAINHREANPLSADYSGADFEWYDDQRGSAPKVPIPNNPSVPNMRAIFVKQNNAESGRAYWYVNNQESETYAIGHFAGVTAGEFVSNAANTYQFTWTILGKTMGAGLAKPLLFPNEWIDDAVSLGIAGETEWAVASPLLDAGFISVSTTKRDKNRYFKSVQRKRNSDGSWVDTNNSTQDFIVGRASLLP